MLATTIIVVVSTALLLAYKLIPNHDKRRNPPMVGRLWLPFLGCAIPFNKNPPKFLQRCQQQYGSIFTVHMAGRLMTYITDFDHFDYFFSSHKSNQIALSQPKNESESEAVSFDYGVQEFTARVFGIPSDQFLSEHHVLLTSLRAALSPNASLPLYAKRFCDRLHFALETTDLKKKTEVNDLFDTCSQLMFWCALGSLFGEDYLKNSKLMPFGNLPGTDNEFRHFHTLDKYFELAASGLIPKNLLPGFNEARDKILNQLTNYKKDCEEVMSDPSKENAFITLLQALEKHMESSDNKVERNHAIWGLALVWASQANSLASTFWTLTYLLNNEDCMQKVKKELDPFLTDSDTLSSSDLTPENLPYLTACVKEGMRLQSPGILIRKVTRPIKLTATVKDEKRQYVIPKGHTLCISPYVSHRNKEVFQNPEKFYPDRWLIGDKQYHDQLRKCFLPFGRGQNLCPGMNFAMAEMVSFIAILLNTFPHMHIKDGRRVMPEADVTRMVGVPLPKTKVSVNLYR